jgi:hypothetical protein
MPLEMWRSASLVVAILKKETNSNVIYRAHLAVTSDDQWISHLDCFR